MAAVRPWVREFAVRMRGDADRYATRDAVAHAAGLFGQLVDHRRPPRLPGLRQTTCAAAGRTSPRAADKQTLPVLSTGRIEEQGLARSALLGLSRTIDPSNRGRVVALLLAADERRVGEGVSETLLLSRWRRRRRHPEIHRR